MPGHEPVQQRRLGPVPADRSRHHDVADLFSRDSVVEILGRGVFIGPERVREDGRWKFQYLHAYQTFYTGYEEGWANWSSPIFAPYERLPPDLPQSVEYEPYPAAFVPPFHYPNPVSGREDHVGDPHWHDPR